MDVLRKNPIPTIIVVAIAVVGGIVTIINPESLSFSQYSAQTLAAASVLGIGRGLQEIGK
jgi:hypothetical protein